MSLKASLIRETRVIRAKRLRHATMNMGDTAISYFCYQHPHDVSLDRFAGLHLGRGDTIIVPEELDRVPFIMELGDITTVLYQITVAPRVLFTAIF